VQCLWHDKEGGALIIQSFRLAGFTRRMLRITLLVQLLLSHAAVPRGRIVSAGRVKMDDATSIAVTAAHKWVQATKLTDSSGADGDRFGRTVAISGDGSTVVVGSPYYAASGTERACIVRVCQYCAALSPAHCQKRLTVSQSARAAQLHTCAVVRDRVQFWLGVLAQSRLVKTKEV
jgi:hypothetical protein